jgi:hypothetical protein
MVNVGWVPVLRGFVSGVATVGLLTHCERRPDEASTSVSSAAAVSATAPPSQAAPPKPKVAGPSPALTDMCTRICDNSRKLKCKNVGECEPNCIGMGSIRPCVDAVAALYTCLGKEPVEHWECAEEGVASIRVGYCDREQEAAVTCMEKNLKE